VRTIDLHAYPGTEPWIRSQDPYPEALAQYWHHAWTPKTEEQVVQDFTTADVEVVMVAFDIESITGSAPCTNEYVAGLRDRHPERIIQGWAAVDPFKDTAIEDAERAIRDLRLLGFHFHPIMGRYAVNDPRLRPLFETINALHAPVMIDVGTTGMGAGMRAATGPSFATLIRQQSTSSRRRSRTSPSSRHTRAGPGWTR